MNYAQFSPFKELYTVATRGVPKEWLIGEDGVSTAFNDEFKIALECIYDMSKEEAKKKEDAHNYCPEPEYILEPFKWVLPHGVKPRDGLKNVKVIITAQDPYPRLNDAVGLAFHSPSSRTPLSAKRIHENLVAFGHIPSDTEPVANYTSWTSQGVLLANRTFTTIEGTSGAHSSVWKEVLDKALQMISKDSVAILLGDDAKSLVSVVPSKARILHSHPVARDADFNSKDVFGLANIELKKMGLAPIDWTPGPPGF